MKNFLLPLGLGLGAFFINGLDASARERSLDEMKILAQQILQQKGPRKANSYVSTPLKVLDAKTQMSILGYAEGSFVVMSNDDAMPAVLGYSDSAYDAASTNPNLNSYLELLNGYMDYCLENGVEFRVIRHAGASEKCGPLMTTKWDQESPYSDMCPTYNGRHCVTGCVATAAAQIFNYLQLPNSMSGRKIYTFENDGNQRERIDYTYDGVVFDWSKMQNTYNQSSSEESRKAVAELMYCCGVSASMDYSTGVSGGWPDIVVDAMTWFMEGLTGETSYMNDHPQLVYDEIDAHHPLLYTGYTKQISGHAFVLDGYDEKGYIHCNMGWSGGGDGFYVMSDMNGYCQTQKITTINPSEEPIYTATPCADVPLGNVKVDLNPVTEIIPDTQWYLLYNVGRGSHPFSAGKGKKMMTTCFLPIDVPAEVAAPHIVRFVTSTNSKKPGYFIQFGDGLYVGSLADDDNKGTTTSKTANYSYGKIKTGYFWFHDEKNDFIMDSDGPGGALLGWGQTVPTDTTGNSSWQIFPVEFSIPEAVQQLPVEEEKVSELFDLQGRPVARPERGQIYIRSRKKVIY